MGNTKYEGGAAVFYRFVGEPFLIDADCILACDSHHDFDSLILQCP